MYGQTSSQVLLRFEQDVVSLQPETVVILAGTNDVARHLEESETEANYLAMAELSRANRIRVVFASLLPVHNTFDSGLVFRRPVEKIKSLNTWIKGYSEANNITYLDFFTPMVDDHGLLKKELSRDGLHPNDEGYRIMTVLLRGVLDRGLLRD